MNCKNCEQPIEAVNNAGRYWRHCGRPGGIGAAWCDESATIAGPRAEPPALLDAKALKDEVYAMQPTFAYSLAMYLTRDGQQGNAPEMQGEIEQFLVERRKR